MVLFRSAGAVASINLHRWIRDIRIWLILFVTVLCVDRYLRDLVQYGLSTDQTVTFCMLPFLFFATGVTVNAPKMIFHIGMLLLLCDAPFFHPSTPYMVLRSKRNGWWVGECLYIMETALFYMGFLSIVSSLYVLPIATLKNDWGSAAYALVYGSETQTALEIWDSFQYPVPVPRNAVVYLYPFACQLYTFLTGWATFSFLGLLMYAVSLASKKVVWGMVVSGIFILLDPILVRLARGFKYWLQAFSPVCWSTIDCLNELSQYYFISIPFVSVMYPVLIAVLLICIWRLSQNAVIELR